MELVRTASLSLVVALPLIAGCNRYELFRLAGYQQASWSDRADILFVIDNSPSMAPFTEDLADNFEGFVDQLSAVEDQVVREDLGDAVGNYLEAVRTPGAWIDYQLGITIHDVEANSGLLLGNPKVLARGDDRLANKFVTTLLDEATCSAEPCGSALEEPLEAVFLAMCRSVPNPPNECFEEFSIEDVTWDPLLNQGDKETNKGFLRENSMFLPVLVTEEGDYSRRMAQGDVVADEYLDLTSRFNRHVAWVVIGPPTHPETHEPTCPGFSADWAAARYDFLVQQSNGLKANILDATSCEAVDFETSLTALGNLLQSMLTSFPLDSVPVETTILVFVDGDEVPRSEVTGTDDFGIDQLSSGWEYQPDTNSIRFYGEAIPPYDAKVQVYYEPIDGMPRAIPL